MVRKEGNTRYFKETMSLESKKGMFGDRRTSAGRERRRQSLAMPSELDRRAEDRRNRSFDAQPWWLRVDYADELVSEKLMPNITENTSEQNQTSRTASDSDE